MEKKVKSQLIVIDGSDGSGKKTQVALLRERLLKSGKNVRSMAFPQYSSFFGELVSNYLLGAFGTISSINPRMVSLLYALDRYGAKDELNGWLDEGNIVVLDRYVESNMAYQSAKLEKHKWDSFIQWIEELEFSQLKVPKADLVIYLHVPVRISQQLIDGRPDKEYLDGKKKDIHEQDTSYLKKVEEAYLWLAGKRGWHTVSCVRDGAIMPKEEISALVWEIVRKHLEGVLE